MVVEKTPRYFVEPKVPQRIRNLLPHVKLIIVLRNPFDRLVSDWLQEVENEFEAKLDFIGVVRIVATNFGHFTVGHCPYDSCNHFDIRQSPNKPCF